MQKIRLGVIGTGMAWERLHYPAILELGDKYEIVSLCNRTLKDAQNFAQKINLDLDNVYDDYNEMLKRTDIDAVDILVPIEYNYEVSEKVARAGKDFICEKPMASNMDDAKKFLELSKKYNVKIMIAENFRYNEENNKIRDIVNSKKIGDVIYFIRNNVSCFPCEITKNTFAATEWRQHPKFKGGAFLDAALHDIAGIRHIFGAVESVHGLGKPQQQEYSPYHSINSNILFKNGIIGQYTYFPSGIESQKPPIGFRIYGTKGEIYLEDKECGIINVSYPDGTSEKINYTPKRGFYNELLNFYNALNGSEEISVTPEIEYGDVKMVFDILESISKKDVVYVDGSAPIKHMDLENTHEPSLPYIQ
ncbi:Gfo/Idh/MocA family oxidoreductase [Herbivorax sp. ANBcel31]|uniref:Gfo/Idh/MocA family protein n=1 Tax=Herbivorax sp. ANBcel31 TaxID=3069754 RepID=UPI0027B332DF|nr:Gfo/Idh/MocA family oxidoreductase [Herbivorax sp. ANBcel31]MDQ2087792.1 Gfo/Idh/MocA family oxidoreductase [Herbivorax sp. ANBcel31]